MVNLREFAKDFENFLVSNNLFKPGYDSNHHWADKLIEAVDQAVYYTPESNMDGKWFADLFMLQLKYGNDFDMFGSYSELVGTTNKATSQFFTPMNVALMMNEIVMAGAEKKPGEPITIDDCCCGSGRFMVAHAYKHILTGKGEVTDYIYHNKDIEYKSVIFTLLNASLRGLTSIVEWGDTLAMTTNATFVTYPVPGTPWSKWDKYDANGVLQKPKKIVIKPEQPRKAEKSA